VSRVIGWLFILIGIVLVLMILLKKGLGKAFSGFLSPSVAATVAPKTVAVLPPQQQPVTQAIQTATQIAGGVAAIAPQLSGLFNSLGGGGGDTSGGDFGSEDLSSAYI
jgi:hypothetical protein